MKKVRAVVLLPLLFLLVCVSWSNDKQEYKSTINYQSSKEVLDNYKPSKEVLNIIQEENNQFQFNKDYVKRDQILNINVAWGKNDLGGTVSYENLNVKQLESLIINKFIDPFDRQNESPSAKEFFIFMAKYSRVMAYGYAVSPKREDYRVTIEGIYVNSEDVTPQLKKDFLDFCKNADELSTENGLYSWWD